MKLVLVDTNIWIDYFRFGKFSTTVESLLEENRVATCGVIKAELFPFLKKKKVQVTRLLHSFPSLSFEDSDWNQLIQTHETILSKNNHPYGIADLIILTICIKHKAGLLTQDKDFLRLEGLVPVEMHNPFH